MSTTAADKCLNPLIASKRLCLRLKQLVIIIIIIILFFLLLLSLFFTLDNMYSSRIVDADDTTAGMEIETGVVPYSWS